MAVIPSGDPAWLHTNNFETYGGHEDKRNYMAQGVTDPTSDVSAEQFSRLVEDTAQIGRTASFATLTYQCNDSSPAIPTILSYTGMAGSAPTPTRNGNGDVTWNWEASYTDSYGVSAPFNIGHARASVQSSSAAAANHAVSDANVDGLNETVRVVARTSANAAIPDAVVTLIVWTAPV